MIGSIRQSSSCAGGCEGVCEARGAADADGVSVEGRGEEEEGDGGTCDDVSLELL